MILPAVATFAFTNIDDLVVLALFFSQARIGAGSALHVIAGQYLGFVAIVAVSVAGGLGADLLPESAIAYLGLIPLVLGVRAGVGVWRQRDAPSDQSFSTVDRPTVPGVAAVTFANGADNISVYIPVFALGGAGTLPIYIGTFLAMLALWCAAARVLAAAPGVERFLTRWGHIVFPAVLIGIGLVILVRGSAFGL